MSNGLMFIAKTYSPLHAGIGQSIGKVDLPIEREKHTEYPCVFATGLKGSLRSHSKGKLDEGVINKIFGKKEGEEGAGEVVFTDLKLLLFPVRSSEGSFKYVITENIINRFKRDYQLIFEEEFSNTFGDLIPHIDSISRVDPEEHIILEDFVFPIKEATEDKLWDISLNDIYVIEEDVFKYLVTNATQIIARNVLDDETKTSKNVWYEEALPADTVLYTFMKPSIILTDETLLDTFKEILEQNNILQIGGNETVGYGICEVKSL